MTPDSSTERYQRTRLQVLATALAAFFVGLLIVVGLILPAEFSLDPLGTGKVLGLMGLAEEGSGAVVLQESVHKTDRVSFRLSPFESVEYSYRMDLGGVMVFSWRADGELVFNLHSTPDLGPFATIDPDGSQPDRNDGWAQSFSNGRSTSEQGSYTATFTGQHGWFWENRTNEDVTLELATSGFIGASLRSAVGGQERGAPRPAL